MNLQTILYWIIGIVVVVAAGLGGWFFFTGVSKQTPATTTSFGVGDNRTVSVQPGDISDGAPNTPTNVSSSTRPSQKVFKVADGPITTATLVQTYHPTTTIARYIQKENGHALELVLESAGVVSRAISNTTIPGTQVGHWAEDGRAVILQYLEDTTIKTVYLGFPASTTATSSRTQPVRIQFFPDNITDYGISADGKNVAYLLKTATGADGYIAKDDGTARQKLFSIPLSQVLISWPAPNNILLQTKSAANITAVVFSINAASGAVSPLVYAPGVTAMADKTFQHVVYQRRGESADSYVHDIKTGKDKPLSFNPIPEKCAWSKTRATIMYCAAPLEFVTPSYLDDWHKGTASARDAIFMYDVATGFSQLLATPGSNDGGIAADIAELAVSPDDHYLVFVKKGDRSLWGVRLGSSTP
jgi:hypothetical protein